MKTEKNKFDNIITELKQKLDDIDYIGDIGDIGNEIGFVLGSYICKDKMGYEYENFINGVKHGISITDGSHE